MATVVVEIIRKATVVMVAKKEVVGGSLPKCR